MPRGRKKQQVLSLSQEALKELRKPNNGLYNVERIKRKWVAKTGEVMYLVRWAGYPKSYDTWEPPESFDSCPEIIVEFEELHEIIEQEKLLRRRQKQSQKEGQTSKNTGKRGRKKKSVDVVDAANEPSLEYAVRETVPQLERTEPVASNDSLSGEMCGDGIALTIVQTQSISLEQFTKSTRDLPTRLQEIAQQNLYSDNLVGTQKVDPSVPSNDNLEDLNEPLEDGFLEIMNQTTASSGDVGGNLEEQYQTEMNIAVIDQVVEVESSDWPDYAGMETQVIERDYSDISHDDDQEDQKSVISDDRSDEMDLDSEEAIPLPTLEQSSEDKEFIRILQREEIKARYRMKPTIIGCAKFNQDIHYIAEVADDESKVSIWRKLANEFFFTEVVDFLGKIPRKYFEDHDPNCYFLREGFCRIIWDDIVAVYVVKMHFDQQRFLLQPTDSNKLSCDNCRRRLLHN